MIPRTLVPVDIKKVDAAAEAARPAPRRLSSTLDLRSIIPRDLPIKTMDATSAIPEHVTFDVIVGRSIIGRNWHVEAGENHNARRIETALDARTVVPAIVEPASDADRKKLEELPALHADLLDVVEPDIMTTGEANLLIGPHEERDARWNTVARMFSLAFHVAIILLALSSPDLFKHIPSQAEIDSAQKQLGYIYMPPGGSPGPPRPSGPRVRVPKTITKNIAPPEIPNPEPPAASKPAATPQPVPNDLPAAPTPRPTPTPSQPAPTSNLNATDIPPPPNAPPQPGKLNLSVPNSSPGHAIQNAIDNAAQGGGGVGALRPAPSYPGGGGGGSGGGSGGGHGPGMGNGYQIMTPTDGVDFSAYIQRMLASIERNWYSIIPESARLGDKGAVVTQFKILPSGQVPDPDPSLIRTSGKEPLDRAAMSSIKASNPFEPLPSAYHRPYFEIRIIFLYNLPLDYYQ
jgi:TonB family protein